MLSSDIYFLPRRAFYAGCRRGFQQRNYATDLSEPESRLEKSLNSRLKAARAAYSMKKKPICNRM
jgi:hypothetical protein